ncbi:MAG TPA: zinc ribbon domain-containing protein [Pyrinomonadaceae bacterium]|nr:zinc ribbon domain-containing protein [Pyrinomonadaceae bacterium]
MEMRCQKCGASVNADQAFCSKCGAVVGMSDTAQKGDEWDMAATMVGKKMPIPESSKPTVVRKAMPDSPRPTPPPQQAYTPSQPPQQPQQPYQQPASSGSNAMLLAVVGLVAVLLIGALLALLFYLNSQG